ncbi:GatB/YqeY domain-containing protein [Pelagibaculum spongiae]|uniref:Glutamyl-tRNA amidotransferase n=1 Tax=Pelagibaculum spongiae TaxID=2080658 RepID=A0A2V1GX03_9GAMM|nr:GatB/YqeY domain-containing protein [Pelagibaculum spongiae]PVZ65665.1 glutamyl-tRNA amidotransferase [Pelagibaculum spongiae]
MSSLKLRLKEDQKAAMRAKAKSLLAVIRQINAAIKQIEIDQRIELDDVGVVTVLNKMVKQRRDSITQYEAAERQELADQEKLELDVIATYLPQPLSPAEIEAVIEEVVTKTGANSMQDMGKVMGQIKAKVEGRADMGDVSKLIKARLSN